MIERDTINTYRHVIEKELIERFGKDYSGKDVLDHFFGSYQNDYINGSCYALRKYEASRQSAIQRLNMLWVVPVYFVTVAPLMWIFTGSTGLKAESFFYKVIRFIIGKP